MENHNTASSKAGDARADSDASRIDQLGQKLKTRFAEVRLQLDASQAKAREKIGTGKLGERVRGVFQQAFGKVKHGLDLPSRGELDSLVHRIEELDRKMAQYETRSTTGKKPTAEGDNAGLS